MQVKAEYASVADFVKISVLERTSKVNGGELLAICFIPIHIYQTLCLVYECHQLRAVQLAVGVGTEKQLQWWVQQALNCPARAAHCLWVKPSDQKYGSTQTD